MSLKVGGGQFENLIWFLENSRNNVRFPYFREEGGGQERYKNFLIFYFLIRGRREGVQVNKDNFFIYALFLLMASLIHMWPVMEPDCLEAMVC